eukprot:TRINITY_DN12318_c0_g1_i1.p1 TRINITY_DN12318_c0_g1~~TRINITY_DN12318_c0_g1_i1.p1  ORF type:complete len:195 (+),score=34.27 TRINITY_DN12318_c0_g1_i1:21-605(+)
MQYDQINNLYYLYDYVPKNQRRDEISANIFYALKGTRFPKINIIKRGEYAEEITNSIREILPENNCKVAFFCCPSSKLNNENETSYGHMEEIAMLVVQNLIVNGIAAQYLKVLERTKSVKSQIENGNRRTMLQHLDSLRESDQTVFLGTFDYVFMVDDIFTSGGTARAIEKIISDYIGKANYHNLTVGKTTSRT